VYEISRFSWTKKKAAQLLFGSVPDVSMSEAINAFERVKLQKSDWLVNILFLAKANKYAGNKVRCEQLLQQIVRAEGRSVEDHRTIKAARKLLGLEQ
jgi:hypothetical protein